MLRYMPLGNQFMKVVRALISVKFVGADRDGLLLLNALWSRP